jgi:hypothetical protein
MQTTDVLPTRHTRATGGPTTLAVRGGYLATGTEKGEVCWTCHVYRINVSYGYQMCGVIPILFIVLMQVDQGQRTRRGSQNMGSLFPLTLRIVDAVIPCANRCICCIVSCPYLRGRLHVLRINQDQRTLLSQQ